MIWTRWGSIGLATLVLVGCNATTASFDDTREIEAPRFAPVPPAPAESPQLDALVLRDTAGFGAPGPNADPTLVGEALAALRAQFPRLERVSDLYFDDENVWLTIVGPNTRNLSRSVLWSRSSDLYIGEEDYVEEAEENSTYPISDVDVDAITALVEGLAVRYPSVQIDLPRLDVGLSYDLGLSWRLDLVDVRGTLATIFADLDGTITAVDQGS